MKARSGRGAMLLFGSSSMNGSFGHLMADDLEQLGFQVMRHGYAAAGLARPDFRDLRQLMDKLPISRTVRTSVLLYIGGNDGQSLWLHPHERGGGGDEAAWVYWTDERWPGLYEARATALIRSLCERGAQHVIVLPPADVTSPRLQGRLNRIRSLLKRAAQASECGHFITTAGDLGHFTVDGEATRAGDGVHMTRLGAQLLWDRVRESVLGLVLTETASTPVAKLD